MNGPVELKKLDSLNSLEEALVILNLLIAKIQEMEARESVRDVGIIEEIAHFRKETGAGFTQLRNETREGFEELESKVDENTLAVKSLENVMKSVDKGMKSLNKGMQSLDKGMKGDTGGGGDAGYVYIF